MSIRKNTIAALVLTAAIAGPTAAASACAPMAQAYRARLNTADNARHTARVQTYTRRQVQLRYPT